MPIPVLPETYKPFEGGVDPLPIETPPPLCTNNLVEPFTCALKALTPDALFTCNLSVGLIVPMPILPRVSTRIRSRFLVKKRSGTALVVPNFEEVVALLLPAKLQ